MRILFAEDEQDLNHIVTQKLKLAGYSVDSVYDGQAALDILFYTDYDAIILDITMPKVDGLTVLRTLRQKGSKVPVIFLTARDAIEDRVRGLDSGANDYLIKPFSFDELIARLRAITRVSFQQAANTLTLGDLTLNCATKTVRRAEHDIPLSAKEYALLEYLMYNQGVVLSKEKIENHIWNFDYEGGTNVVAVYINSLRKKIDDDFPKKLIHTVRGHGYILREDT